MQSRQQQHGGEPSDSSARNRLTAVATVRIWVESRWTGENIGWMVWPMTYSTSEMPWPWNPGHRSLKVIRTDTDRSAIYDFLLTLHSNYGSISYHFRDKRRFQSKVANFSHPVHLTPRWRRFAWNWVPTQITKMMGLPDGQKSFKICLTV